MSFGIPVRNGLGIGLLPSTAVSTLRIGGRPALVLNFVSTTSLDSRITFTRTTTATVTGSNGAIQSSAINDPRFDYDPVTLAPKGLLIEEQRINLLLNSLINGTSLSTQSVTVTAAAHTISFYGTGSITLTGAAIATVTGTGVYPNRQTLTFTPTVGVLVCTVSGSVQYAQLEAGAYATSFIPTAGTAVTRTLDNCNIVAPNFAPWYNQSEGTFVFQGSSLAPSTLAQTLNAVTASDGTNNNIQRIGRFSNFWFGETRNGNVQQAAPQATAGSYTQNATAKVAYAYKTNDFALSVNGAAAVTDTSGTVPTVVTRLDIGNPTIPLNGHVRSVVYYNTRLPNTTLRVLSL